jgi:hypothetical protein
MNIDIVPTPFTSTSIITKVGIKVIELVLYQHILIAITYIDADGKFIYHSELPSTLLIEKEEYAQWGQDDTYITQNVMEKLGLVLPPPPTLPE